MELIHPREYYTNYSKKIYFTYLPRQTQFQQGLLGLQPSKIAGVFHLRYSQDRPLKAKRIVLYFKGKTFVRFDEGNEQHKLKQQFLNMSKTIWTSQSEGNFEDITSLDIPFEFDIPNTSPSTVISMEKTGIGLITYTLQAKIFRVSHLLLLQHVKAVKCRLDINRWATLPSPDYYPAPFSYGLPKFQCQLLLDQSVFGIGNVIPLPIKFILFDMRVCVKKITVRIKEYHLLKLTLELDNPKSKIIKVSLFETIVGGDKVLPVIGSNNEFMVTIKCDLRESFRKIQCDCETPLIDIWHMLKIKVNMENAGVGHLYMEKEMKIYNILQNDLLVGASDD
ncbi:5711_t:CDS:1 [Acaulospora morrowiae]|uniref:5711_t:CDS:1 n=1 Tax=Acaulospora morrowiae TaxID=94023 RepID=A0A9N9GHX9_9GLOM|nr:5711_t:CDS:1 [Acaulospora morrowiae]